MKLIGMLDSPYVRRVAIALEVQGIAFQHEAVSVFSDFAKFQAINPVVKAPTLVCDDGELIMDSSVILQFIEATVVSNRSLWPTEPLELQHDSRAVSLALAACEKCAQTIYERNLRPAASQYEPWLARLQRQLRAALAGLEHEVAARPAAFAALSHASIAAAIAWQFTHSELAAAANVAQHPALADLSGRMERLPEFRKYPPVGPGVKAGG